MLRVHKVGLFLAAGMLAALPPMLDAEEVSGVPNDTVELKLPGSAPAELSIGSKAPALDIESWVNPPSGKVEPLTEPFKAGDIYLVEFWATWCAPCVASMPHIAQLQQQYADKKVTVISISNEDLPTIDKFLTREVPADVLAGTPLEGKEEPITFRQLTSAYRLTSDTDLSTQRDYMESAGESGIPTAFLVGKTGLVEWIGHPMEVDGVLTELVADTWDRAAYKAKIEKDKQLERLMKQVVAAVRKQQPEQASKLLDTALEGETDPNTIAHIKQLKLRVLLTVRDSGAAVLAKEMIDGTDDSNMLNGFAWTVFQLHNKEAVPADLLALAMTSANKALELAVSADEKSGVRDTLAHLLASQGKVADAIAMQTAAVSEASPELGRQLQPYLEELQLQQAGGNNNGKPAAPAGEKPE